MSAVYRCTCGWECPAVPRATSGTMKCERCNGIAVLVTTRGGESNATAEPPIRLSHSPETLRIKSLELRVDGLEAAVGELRRSVAALSSSVLTLDDAIAEIRGRMELL